MAPHGGLREGDIAAVGQIWFNKAGYCKIKRVQGPKDAQDLAAYVAKYMTKDFSDLVFSPGLSRRLDLEHRFGRL